MSNYVTEADLKNATGVDTLSSIKKTDFPNLKSDVDKLDIDKYKNVLGKLNYLKCKSDKFDVDKLIPLPADLSKLSNVVKKMTLLKKII